MGKEVCGHCKWLKFLDNIGNGWCEQLEEADVNVRDGACVEFEKKDYEFVKDFRRGGSTSVSLRDA